MLKIEKMPILIGLLLISKLACACGSDTQQESMAKRLYTDLNICGMEKRLSSLRMFHCPTNREAFRNLSVNIRIPLK